ncbi:MAG: 5'-methylthioadenosine/adenosylhomocysteine nucleosidase, partial [Eubacterium sp.]|nr:5'-methylthioadenosine/adenosylhomocysteine nucleosidase [Eubacterium sp.]
MNRIGIIGAMDIEVDVLKEQMADVTRVNKASMEFYQGKLNGKDVVVVRSGIGKVNAAVCTQILADVFE